MLSKYCVVVKPTPEREERYTGKLISADDDSIVLARPQLRVEQKRTPPLVRKWFSNKSLAVGQLDHDITIERSRIY